MKINILFLLFLFTYLTLFSLIAMATGGTQQKLDTMKLFSLFKKF